MRLTILNKEKGESGEQSNKQIYDCSLLICSIQQHYYFRIVVNYGCKFFMPRTNVIQAKSMEPDFNAGD
jgi:hypothetical protein